MQVFHLSDNGLLHKKVIVLLGSSVPTLFRLDPDYNVFKSLYWWSVHLVFEIMKPIVDCEVTDTKDSK